MPMAANGQNQLLVDLTNTFTAGFNVDIEYSLPGWVRVRGYRSICGEALLFHRPGLVRTTGLVLLKSLGQEGQAAKREEIGFIC